MSETIDEAAEAARMARIAERAEQRAAVEAAARATAITTSSAPAVATIARSVAAAPGAGPIAYMTKAEREARALERLAEQRASAAARAGDTSIHERDTLYTSTAGGAGARDGPDDDRRNRAAFEGRHAGAVRERSRSRERDDDSRRAGSSWDRSRNREDYGGGSSARDASPSRGRDSYADGGRRDGRGFGDRYDPPARRGDSSYGDRGSARSTGTSGGLPSHVAPRDRDDSRAGGDGGRGAGWDRSAYRDRLAADSSGRQNGGASASNTAYRETQQQPRQSGGASTSNRSDVRPTSVAVPANAAAASARPPAVPHAAATAVLGSAPGTASITDVLQAAAAIAASKNSNAPISRSDAHRESDFAPIYTYDDDALGTDARRREFVEAKGVSLLEVSEAVAIAVRPGGRTRAFLPSARSIVCRGIWGTKQSRSAAERPQLRPRLPPPRRQESCRLRPLPRRAGEALRLITSWQRRTRRNSFYLRGTTAKTRPRTSTPCMRTDWRRL